jgi:hypothetical protein
MPDPIAVWGAFTGTTAVGIALRRERISNRRRIRVDHGWQYILSQDDPPELDDWVIYVMVQNTGGRDISVEHVGWEWLVYEGKDDETGVSVFRVHRAEIPLEESVLLKPDGAPAKFRTMAGPLLHLVDPLETPVWAVAFTHGGNTPWRGREGRLAQQLPAVLDEQTIRTGFERLRDRSDMPISPGRNEVYSLRPGWTVRMEDLEGTSGAP